MEYHKIQPPAHLRSYVRYFWTLDSDSKEPVDKKFKTIADGSPGLIFHHSEQGGFAQNGKKLPKVFLYGQCTRYNEIESPSGFKTIGAYFYSNALRSIFGLNAHELTDTCADVTDLPAGNISILTEQLVNSKLPQDRADILSSYLSQQIKNNRCPHDAAVQNVLNCIIQADGDISIKSLIEKAGVSERTLERKFQQSIGMSPKLYSRIYRFQTSLQQLRINPFQKLSDIAFENDYADQSHFIRTFKEFAGFSPFNYSRKYNEMVENFPEVKN
jgi:AraC-like DNA-binding protein